MHLTKQVTFTIACTLLLCLTAPVSLVAADDGGMVSVAAPAGAVSTVTTELGEELQLEGYGYQPVAGMPRLPSRIFAIEIPPGAEMTSVTFEIGSSMELPGVYNVAPTPLHRVIGDEDPAVFAVEQARFDANYQAVYQSDAAFPAENVEFVRNAGYRGHNLVDVRVTPFSYHPVSGRLIQHSDITINVTYAPDGRTAGVTVDNLAATERVARQIVLNYEQARQWAPPAVETGRGMYDYVIITADGLVGAVQAMADWETAKGRNVNVVTTQWIYANYTGYDNAEKIRNFLRDKYPSSEWGITDVLIAADRTTVPHRRTAEDLGYGQPETDFYYAELSAPDYLSWDSDGDHQYGESSGDSVDFYNEVNVGRIPWGAASTIEAICAKSIAYEQNDDPSFKKNMLLLGGYFWADTDNAVLMETKIDQDWMSDWTFTRMYEKNTDYWSTYNCDYPLLQSNVMSVWPTGHFAFVNWGGHGSPTSAHIYGLGAPAFIDTGDCPSLSDEYPAIIFADACSNSDTDYGNLGKAMVNHGAVAFVGATKVAYGCPAWSQPYSGSSQSLDYFFTTWVTSGEETVGGALQRALREMYTHGLWNYNHYETYEWGALWGNPDLSMFAPPALTIIPGELPEYMSPGAATTIQVDIRNGSESYVAGSGAMYCRYDGGVFVEVPLTPVGGTIYQAALPPASCDDSPEYYFAADGDGGSTVTAPYGAPANLFDAQVGDVSVFFTDDFESDLGWTVTGDAADGPWDRGVPAGGGLRGDPANDYDGSGSCYLTDNVEGNSDVDDGTTYLISPTIDLSGGDAEVSFALWYTNNFGADPNNDLFKIYVSNNNGGAWILVETVGPQTPSGWNMHSFTVGDFVTPTAQVKVRFEASDLNSGSVVEAGIDAFEIMAVTCEDAYCPGDLDGDMDVDLSDLAQLLANYGMVSGAAYEDGDMDLDGDVDLSDLAALLGVYGTTCP